MKDIFEWIKENTESWEILCGKKTDVSNQELIALYDDIMKLAGENGQYHILISTFLDKYGKKIFPDMSSDFPIRTLNHLAQKNMVRQTISDKKAPVQEGVFKN